MNGFNSASRPLSLGRFKAFTQALGMIISFFLLIAPPVLATGAYAFPIPNDSNPLWVVDQGDIISPLTEGRLEGIAKNLAQSTDTQVHFVTVHRLDYEETPTTFATKLLNRWYPEPEDQANQAILALDTVTNGTYLITGEAVKAKLPDDIAESIAQATMRVPIKNGNYNQAFLDASARIEAVLSGQPDPGPPVEKEVVAEKTYKSLDETDDRSATVIVIVLLIAATVIPMVTYYWYQGSS
ncbi:TPM domain-containing protein [Thermosynechococcaceae cyanobacterium BACA0444]|uniref:TPM domain-containing protein n=1 Tax=Pseudocalidococcus azoricus BACA0444 TaxID=2918990 RepID=A0AAE4FTP4_9CYAN|nr:TPM domain-containing protein [Pseudocalidococcus azoricus]MDS3861144.1 TPM domain-containing protein [Pseudocalidococcus azoricus BACA0444]